MLITDWNMPEMNGIEFVKAVRALERYNNIPILMVTSVNFKKEVYEAVKSGVNGYLVKPFKEQELLQKIQSIMKYK
jgi:two-component system chemotaxis response regulator CheY